jgi:hypothetical protein
VHLHKHLCGDGCCGPIMRFKNILPHFHVRSVFHNLCYCTHNHMLLNRSVSNNIGSNYDIVDVVFYVLDPSVQENARLGRLLL